MTYIEFITSIQRYFVHELKMKISRDRAAKIAQRCLLQYMETFNREDLKEERKVMMLEYHGLTKEKPRNRLHAKYPA